MPHLLSLSVPVQEVLKPVLLDTFYFNVTELILIFSLYCLLSDTITMHVVEFYAKLEMFQILRSLSGTSLRLCLGPFTALLVVSDNLPLLYF